MSNIVTKIMPIPALIILGYLMREKEVFQQQTIDEMKKFVINFVLPALLFITFLRMELKNEYYMLFLLIFLMLCSFYIFSLALNKINFLHHPLMPFATSACAVFNIGMPLFSTIFGFENVDKLSLFGVGHEFYVWFILFTQLRIKLGSEKLTLRTGLAVFKTPIIIGIVSGLIFNIAGLMAIVNSNPVLQGLYSSLESLASLSTPLILIIIGYGLRFNKKYMKESTELLVIRLAITLTLGYIFKTFIIDTLITTDKIFNYAYFTFLILPPPFSLPMFVGISSTEEYEELANNTVILSTVVSIAVFILFIIISSSSIAF